MADILGIGIGAAAQAGLGALNNFFGAEAAAEARRQNYQYNEWAAQNADARTRRLYNDLYSPSAQLRQLEAAGMSPSVFYQGSGSQGTSGAQGQGTAGQATPYMPISMIEGAQMARMVAETENIKADTKLKESEKELTDVTTLVKNIERDFQSMNYFRNQNDYKMLTTRFEDENGELLDITFNSLANDSSNFEEFSKKVLSYNYDDDRNQIFRSEQGQNFLREIYKNCKRLEPELKNLSLSNDAIDKSNQSKDEEIKLLKWENQLVEAMKNAGFADMNAKAAIKFLEAQIQSSELTEMQKGAWNRLINNMKDGTMKDIVIVLGMILGQQMQNVGVSFSRKF